MDRQTLGVYQLVRLLGRGGMGSVYLAHDPRLSRDVALKMLSPALAESAGFRERFLSEARSCSRLNHPNITTIHEIGREDGVDFIAFEYVEGENLEALLAREGALPPARVLPLALQIAGALSHAHERGVVHRDLKPANVVVSTLGIPKILDFGLAKAVPLTVSSEGDTLARLTQAGTIVGTIAYMAPEQALGEAVDERSDVFSFGCLLYEMLAGRPAFRGATPTQVLNRLLHEEPERLEQIGLEGSRRLAGIVERAMRKRAADRYPTMRELERDLETSRDGGARARTRPGRGLLPGRIRGWASRRAVLGALGGVAVVLAGALFVMSPGARPAPGEGSVAVMYFENLSDPVDSDHTARMLTELLESQIAEDPDLRLVSQQRLHDVARGRGLLSGEVDRSVATEVAKAAAVDCMLVGKVVVAGDRIMASVELVDVQTGEAVASDRARVASSDDLFVLADSLGRGIREELERRAGREPSPSAPANPGAAAELTTSVEAYRHYVDGEVAIHASDFDAAVEELQEAVRLDPDFGLAQFRLSIAARWISDGPVAHQAARRAAANLARVPAHLRDLVQANALYQDGAYSQALPLLERTLAREPEEKEALYIVSQIYVHSLRDGDPEKAIATMERLLALDPGFHQVYDRLALTYAFEGNIAHARELLARWEPIRPDKVEGLRSILATFEGQPEEALGFGQTFSWIEGPLFQASAAMMASRWDVARGLVAIDPDEFRSDHLRAWALRNQAVLHSYLGEFNLAVEAYRQAGMATGLRTHEGASGGVPASALQLLAELYRVAGETGAAREEVERALAIQPESWRGLYYAGRMAFLDGDLEEGHRYLERLTRIPAVETSASARVYLRALQGEQALARGAPAEARELFSSLVSDSSLLLDWASTCSSAGATIREGLVRSELALGKTAGAMAALDGILASGEERVDHPVIYTEALYRLGVLKLESGRADEGRKLLRKFLSQWGSADWKLPIVADAEAKLGSS